MAEMADRLSKLGLEHFTVNEKHKVVTVTDFAEFKGLRGLVEPGGEVTGWCDEQENSSGQSFNHGGYSIVILAKDVPRSD